MHQDAKVQPVPCTQKNWAIKCEFNLFSVVKFCFKTIKKPHLLILFTENCKFVLYTLYFGVSDILIADE